MYTKNDRYGHQQEHDRYGYMYDEICIDAIRVNVLKTYFVGAKTQRFCCYIALLLSFYTV